MPAWAWGIIVPIIGLMGTVIFSAAKFGISAGKLATQLEGVTSSLTELKNDFKHESRAFRDELHTVGRSLAVFEERLAYVESAASPRPVDDRDRRMRVVTPPLGVPSTGGGRNDEGGGNR